MKLGKILQLMGVLILFLMSAPQTLATAVPKTGRFQTDEERLAEAQRILEQLSVEERVGQLFLVTFQGDQATADSNIASLILDYHIGGVILEHENGNITGRGNLDNIPVQVATLNNDLQRLALLGITSTNEEPTQDDSVEPGTIPPTRIASGSGNSIPLIIGVAHEGDGYPNNELWNGISPIPNNMAIGATWDPSQAAIIGNIVGTELDALGFNMLLGPSLDVLEMPSAINDNTLGTRAFGGDPYWVGLMAQAYITGVHVGSDSSIAVVPKHFPGFGSSDRLLHSEVPTVRKSLDQLQQIELAPFIAVTEENTNQFAIADALLTSHIRYQGFQGNIRATTNPVSFDQQALSTLLSQEDIALWRTNGGVIVSDSLGVTAVERFYDDTGQEFPHRVIAKDAFLAGNDLLYLGSFALGDGNYEAELLNIQDTISWFQERYATDATFQQLVDTAVLRILQLKLAQHSDDFSPSNILIDQTNVQTDIAQNQEALLELSQKAVTLISPTQTELAQRLTLPPASDSIVIFSEVEQVQQCATCPIQSPLAISDIENRIITLYGPEASGQIQPEQITSFSLADLDAFLAEEGTPIIYPLAPITGTQTIPADATPTAENTLPTSTPLPPAEYLVQEALAEADWIIFGLTNHNHDTSTLSAFLAQRPDIARNSDVIVFAYTVPYLLDSTEISQLAAYFGVYSKTEPFIDTSVRALFQEIPISGNSPVDIESVRYTLAEETQPNAAQQIALYVVDEEGVPIELTADSLDLTVGDTIHLQTGIILDNNNHTVPDNTIVTFKQRDLVEGTVSIIAEIPTDAGVAELDYLLEARTEDGQFQITAESGPADISIEVNISVGAAGGAAQISVSTPIPTATFTPPPTEEPTATATTTATPTASATLPPSPTAPPATPLPPGVQITLPEMQIFLGMLLGLAAVVGTNLFFIPKQISLTHLIGRLMWGLVGALLFYNAYILGLPGTAVFARLSNWAGLAATILGGGIGLILYNTFSQK